MNDLNKPYSDEELRPILANAKKLARERLGKSIAIRFLESHLVNDPTNKVILGKLSYLCDRIYPDKSLHYAESNYARHPDDILVIKTIIGVHLKQNRAQAAEAILEASKDIAPDDSQWIWIKANYYTVTGNPKAESEWQHGLTIDPYNSHLAAGYGKMLANQGRYADAEHILEKCIVHFVKTLDEGAAIDTIPMEAINKLGEIYIIQKKYTQAQSLLETARMLDPDDALLMYSLANVYLLQGKPESYAAFNKLYQDTERLQKTGDFYNIIFAKGKFLQGELEDARHIARSELSKKYIPLMAVIYIASARKDDGFRVDIRRMAGSIMAFEQLVGQAVQLKKNPELIWSDDRKWGGYMRATAPSRPEKRPCEPSVSQAQTDTLG